MSIYQDFFIAVFLVMVL